MYENLKDILFDVIIIGGGPAGLSAGIYSSRARLNTLLIDGSSLVSQLSLTEKIENYPGFPEGIDGPALLDKFKGQLDYFGAKYINDDVASINKKQIGSNVIWQVKVGEVIFKSKAVIIASGARFKELGIPGENEFRGKGVSYCATCDGAFFKEKELVVIGGGDAALEEALFLTRFASGVTIVHRRDALRAAKILQERALNNSKIKLVYSAAPVEIIGDTKVKSIKIKDVKNSILTEISCEGVFIFIGYKPNTEFLNKIVDLDESGYIITDDNMHTSQEGILAAGDCRKKNLRQVITACADGATAGFFVSSFIDEKKHGA